MSSNTQAAETVSVEQLDEREARALSESMTVLADGGSMFTVVGENGNGEHRVDAKRDRCTCRDCQYNLPTDDGREWCKHRERVAFATGKKAIPAWVDMDRVDDLLGDQLPNSQPRVAATDGGTGASSGDPRGSSPADGTSADRVRVPVAGGVLVYERRDLGKELVGFEDVDDWSDIRSALAARGHGVGAIHQKPVLDGSDNHGREEPTRSEPADFGFGDSTGVQDL